MINLWPQATKLWIWLNFFPRLHLRCDFVLAASCSLQPFEVDGGDVEHDPFEPQDHEEALGERAVADALSIVARLQINNMKENKLNQ